MIEYGQVKGSHMTLNVQHESLFNYNRGPPCVMGRQHRPKDQVSLVPATLSPCMSSMSHGRLIQHSWGQFSKWHIRPCHDITCHGVETFNVSHYVT